MPKSQHKNTINSSQGNMSSPELSYPTTENPEYSKITEAHEKDLKTNLMEMIEFLKEEVNRSFKEIEKKRLTKNGRK